MTRLFYFSFAATIFSALVILTAFLLTRTSRATTRRIREVAGRGRSAPRQALVPRDLGRRFFAGVHWVRSRLGLSEEADLVQRLADAGYKGAFPADVYNGARVL